MKKFQKDRFYRERLFLGWFFFFSLLVLVGLGGLRRQEIRIERVVIVSPLPDSFQITKPNIPILKTEEYIKTIFRDEAELALAVAKGECNGLKPDCKNKTEKEYSVCSFQINIKAHFGKIPGRNFEEKETWLKDPLNCILMAKIVKDFSESWNPWSAYTNGSYKRFL